MILDATASRRSMWEKKESENIVYVDMCRKLSRPPSIICDNTQTPFKPLFFDTIFYDPPYDWGTNSIYWSFPNFEEARKFWTDERQLKKCTAYYGTEIYKSKTALISHIFKAQREFLRILKDNGLLWFKWCELKRPLRIILTLFESWNILLKLRISDVKQTLSKIQTFWVCFEKRREPLKQTHLDQALTPMEIKGGVISPEAS